MKYTVFLTRHEYGFVDVEASSSEEAKEMAFEAESMGDVHWTDSELESSGYELCEDEEE